MNDARGILVVTGVPRSGTSMMMRMLEAGGVPLLCDDTRPPDEHNPHGFFEYAPVARTKADATWVPEGRGRAVKVVSYLVPFLPTGERYRFIHLRRAAREVIASQGRMLRKASDSQGDGWEEILDRQDAFAVAWMQAQGAPYFAVQFREIHADPRAAAEGIADFLGERLDIAAMVAAVDPSLYRNQSGEV